jgi:6-pyruvoyltetrahydropterin/6-carboxytetrahydropterin synthase
MYTITKRFTFSASHQLDHLPPAHPCSRLHGHNYRVEIVLRTDVLDKQGFVVDYGELNALRQYLDETFDHRHLNDVLNLPTTAENIAHHLFGWSISRWPQTVAVRVSETEKTWAEYHL